MFEDRNYLYIGGEWVAPASSVAAPCGGIKHRGLGREFGPGALTAYQQFKSIYLAG
jgi:acyl-CoA reductase-like NAD-dependent aldehyde dehydrogenase